MVILPELLAAALRRERDLEVARAVEGHRLAGLLASVARCCRNALLARLGAAVRGCPGTECATTRR